MSENNISLHLDSALTKISHQVKEKTASPKEETKGSDYLRDLPQPKKREIEEYRQKSENINDKFFTQIASLNKSLSSDTNRIKYLKSKEIKTHDDEQEIDRIGTNSNSLQESISILSESNIDSNLLIKELFQKVTYESLNNYVDNKTGLYLASFTIDKLSEYLSNKSDYSSTKIVLTDIMILHTTNSILGSSETDSRLFANAQGAISVSRYLGNTDFYPTYSKEESDQNKHLNKYFPKNSVIREKLDYLKSQKVEISPFRVNAEGGDEFGFIINTNENIPDEYRLVLEKISLEIIDHLADSTSITHEFDFIGDIQKTRELSSSETEQRQAFYRSACDSISSYKIKQKSVGPDVFGEPRRDLPLTKEEEINNAFCDSLRESLIENPDTDIIKPNINLSIEQTIGLLEKGDLPSLNDSITLFLYGKDSSNSIYSDATSLINEKGDLNQDVIDKYTEQIYQSLKPLLTDNQMTEDQFNQLISKEFYKLIIKNTFNIIGNRIDTYSKEEYKKEITYDAFTRQDTKSLFICGASNTSGRLLHKTKSDQDKIDFISKVRQFYEEKFSTDTSSEIQDFKNDWQDRLSKINAV